MRLDRIHVFVIIMGLAWCASTTMAYGGVVVPSSPRAAMARLVADIKAYAAAKDPAFGLLTNGGTALFVADADNGYGPEDATRALGAVAGILFEDYFYGYEKDGRPTAASATGREFQRDVDRNLAMARERGMPLFNIDYTGQSATAARDAHARNAKAGFVGFAADDRELRDVPSTAARQAREGACTTLAAASNFVAVLSSSAFDDAPHGPRARYLDALRAAPNDLIVIDLSAPPKFGNRDQADDAADSAWESAPLTAAEVASLKKKPNGARRLVYCYLSIGEAENYRAYWKPAWKKTSGRPNWIAGENPDWHGNFKVAYWDPAWRRILFGGPDAQLDQILACGFDGAFLDVVDAFEYYEAQAGKKATTARMRRRK